MKRAELLAGRVLLARTEVDRIGRLAAVDPANTEILSELDRADNELDVLIDVPPATSRPRLSEPFFLYVAYNAPHYPMHAPQEYLDRFPGLPWDQALDLVVIGIGAGAAAVTARLQTERTG